METGKTNTPMMNYLTEDLWAIIISRLPLKSITTSQLVCKQWKSIFESPFFRQIFLSHHQNSQSSWSLMCRSTLEEVVEHYGCKVWGLPRSVGSYISSFITKKFTSMSCPKEKVRVDSYTDIGLVLFSLESFTGKLTYYVANPISQQCVDIPPPPPHRPTLKSFKPAGLATRTENGFVLGYKVVVIDKCYTKTGDLSLLIYSSETGLWSFDTLHSPLPLLCVINSNTISLNGNLYWLGYNLKLERVIVYHNLYATGTESNRCRVIPLPDSEYKYGRRSCTTFQGSLIYMNVCILEMEHKLRLWRLKSWEWQLVYDISPAACSKIGFKLYPLVINPFDGNKIYLWSKVHKFVAIMNLHKGKFGHYSILERSKDVCTLSFAGRSGSTGKPSFFFTFALPRWLYRIPSLPS